MFRATIEVDLPSVETHRRMGILAWIASVFGHTVNLRTGKEELTVGAFSLVEGMKRAFAKAGINDALSFVVDKKVVYMDSNDVDDDLPLIAKAAEAAGVLDLPFTQMYLALAHKSATLHTIIGCSIENSVDLGASELRIIISSRLIELQIKSGETAEQYAKRVGDFVAEEKSYASSLAELDELTFKIAEAVSSTLVGATVQRTAAVVRIIRPDPTQIRSFSQLPFGDGVLPQSYRALPTMQRAGAYHDPFYYYYYDPYYDFTNYVIADSMLTHDTWHSRDVVVVNTFGTTLYSGDCVPSAHSWDGSNAVSFDSQGDCVVSHESSSGSSDSSGWSFFSSDSSSSSDSSTSSCSSSSSCSSNSSCGSSCSSSSSCGSSCNS